MKSTRKTLFAVFAHPDDEAFGPGGTLALFAKDYDVHVICATTGSRGEKTAAEIQLDKIRAEELKQSAAILGVKKVHFLHYADGRLCNANYHRLAQSIGRILDRFQPDTLITFEHRGISGHIDHIVVSMVCSYLLHQKTYIHRILFHCVPNEILGRKQDYFVYKPPGYTADQVDLIMDITAVWDKKLAAIHAHASQKTDISRHMQRIKEYPKVEYFFEMKKKEDAERTGSLAERL